MRAMESIPSLFYNTISNKSFEVINFIKDYLSGNNMGKYCKMTPNNLCGRERIMILSNLFKINITEDEYVYNGYILNSSDRVILVDIEKDKLSFSGSFIYASDPKNATTLTYINSFIINKRLLDNIDIESREGNIQIIKLAYNVCRRYFHITMDLEDNNPIARVSGRNNRISSTRRIYENISDNYVFYIDYLITMIMLLDTIFDLKFEDISIVKAAITFNGSNEIINKCFEEIYNYAIDIDPDPKDYIKIFEKALNNKEN